MNGLRIEDPGPLATVQDAGRLGYQDRGVPACGAMDPAALALGNLLVGNPPGEAGVEISVGGFRGVFLGACRFAVTGADPVLFLNGTPLEAWRLHVARNGDVLEVSMGAFGARQYLCLGGGIDVPRVLGSKSTYLRGRFGGVEGRALRRGDVLGVGGSCGPTFMDHVPEGLRPAYARNPRVRVLLGPQAERITPETLADFLSGTYTVTARSDRMGIMLEGPRLAHTRGADIISDGIAPGSIQVPGEGLPFILMADRPTTGGYVKAATVISMDIPLVAQLLPGDSLQFERVSIEEARWARLQWAFRVRRFFET
ncbi:MAG: biotin-dependent carboxyltransferase [Desulfacinum sp.]|nr:biotin-dependent carboxyltransferase [Desulfacinum sp.]